MKYVSVYKRGDGRPVWYISYPDPTTGRRISRATVHRIEEPQSRRRAYEEAVEETKKAQALLSAGRHEAWDLWVPVWMDRSFRTRTLQRYVSSWRHLSFFLSEKNIPVPRALRYEHAGEYLTWRTNQKRPRGTYINYNTALCELRLLGSVMKEAVRRGFAPGNPVSQLGLAKRPQKEKPEITDEEDRCIRLELEKRPVWMRECYHIAMCQGCRLTETQVPMSHVDLARGAITFHGKGNKVFTTKIHPSLLPLVLAKKEVGARYLCELPPMPAKEWWLFFRDIKMPHLCFHCTKVTVITRLCRAGVPQGIAMSYVNHSKSEVHRVYQRLRLADVSSAVTALPQPSWPSSSGGPAATARTVLS